MWFTKSAEISWGEVTRGTLLKKARIFNIAKGKVKKNCEVVGFMSSFYILDLQVVCCWNFVERWLIHLDLPGPTRELGVSIFARCGTQWHCVWHPQKWRSWRWGMKDRRWNKILGHRILFGWVAECHLHMFFFLNGTKQTDLSAEYSWWANEPPGWAFSRANEILVGGVVRTSETWSSDLFICF